MAHPAVLLTTSPVTLRDATVAELPDLLAWAAAPGVEPYLSGLTEERLRAAFGASDDEVLAIDAGGALAGMLRLDRALWARHRMVMVHSLLVDPGRTGQGIGGAALRALQEREVVRGTHRIQAEAYAFNTDALRLFEAAGFVLEGTRRGAWWRHEAWQDGLLLGWLAPA